MISPFICEYCKSELNIVENPFYDTEYNIIQEAFCNDCNRAFRFHFILSDIEENEIDEEYDE